jgi:hypothetical protein
MKLPFNHYDIELRRIPEFLRAAETDAAFLRDSGRGELVNPQDLTALPLAMKAIAARAEGRMVDEANKSKTSVAAVKHYLRETDEGRERSMHLVSGLGEQYVELVNFCFFGKKVFYVTDGLVQQLANTKMNAEASFLQLPFPSCLLVFTSREFIDILYDVVRDLKPDSVDSNRYYDLSINVLLTMRDGIPDYGNVRIRILRIVILQESPNGFVHLELERELPIRDEWTINQVLVSNYGNIFDDEEENRILREEVDALAEEERPYGRGTRATYGPSDETFYSSSSLLFRVILNSILYIESVSADKETVDSPLKSMEKGLKFLKSEKERQEARRKIEATSRLQYIVVGGSVHPINEDHLPSSIESKRKLTVRFMVKGFWRQQVFGPGRVGRRLQFIKPFYKGPEMADLINKPYIVR